MTLVSKFEEIVGNFPKSIAVIDDEGSLTYDQLNNKANSVGNHIVKSASVDSNFNKECNRKIGLLLDHNIDSIIGIIGCLKADATYIPLDPSFPQNRLDNIINDSDPEFLITNTINLSLAYKLLSNTDKNIKIICISDIDYSDGDNISDPINETNEAYIMYTSGSTGRPKGVVQDNKSINEIINYYINELSLDEKDNTLLVTSYSHAVSVIDIFSTLLSGGTLSVYDVKTNFDVNKFAFWIKSNSVNIIHMVPSLYRFFVSKVEDKELLENIRLVILGGEDVYNSDVEQYKTSFSEKCFLVNLYGSSEAIIGTINILNKDYNNDHSNVSIGYPAEILKAYILDAEKKEMAIHQTGEIYLKGNCLTPKYNNLPEETNNLFIPDTINGEGKLLKTGDLGKLLPDGSIDFVGRADDQIKISGNRVELNDIKNTISRIEEIDENVTISVINDANENQIVAYYTVKESEEISEEEIKYSLRLELPEYMIPKYLVKLSEFPRLPNKKIDRQNLPSLNLNILDNQDDEKISEIEKKMLELWKGVLQNNEINIHDNFFQLGGNSLFATELVNKIYLEWEQELEINIIFDYQTIFELSRLIEQRINTVVSPT